eukprot:765180-Hanusia_phi.AAC.6
MRKRRGRKEVGGRSSSHAAVSERDAHHGPIAHGVERKELPILVARHALDADPVDGDEVSSDEEACPDHSKRVHVAFEFSHPLKPRVLPRHELARRELDNRQGHTQTR